MLNLDELEFVVQRKAELAYKVIDSLIAAQKVDEAKRAIDQLLTLQATIHKKGFRNRDPNFRHNYGWIGGQAILIDVGRIVGAEKTSKNSIATSRFRKYLFEQHPEFLAYFDQSIDTVRMSNSLMRKLIRFFIAPIICAVVFYYIGSFCDQQTDRFSIARIHSDLPFNPAWETAFLSAEKKAELRKLLDQKFHYLGCGGQCFAFASEDGSYVVKFFKHKVRKPFLLLLNMSLPVQLKKACRKKLDKATQDQSGFQQL